MISHDFIDLDISTFFSQIHHFGEIFFQKFLRRPLPQNLQILANLSLCGLGGFPYKSVVCFYYLTFHQFDCSFQMERKSRRRTNQFTKFMNFEKRRKAAKSGEKQRKATFSTLYEKTSYNMFSFMKTTPNFIKSVLCSMNSYENFENTYVHRITSSTQLFRGILSIPTFSATFGPPKIDTAESQKSTL